MREIFSWIQNFEDWNEILGYNNIIMFVLNIDAIYTDNNNDIYTLCLPLIALCLLITPSDCVLRKLSFLKWTVIYIEIIEDCATERHLYLTLRLLTFTIFKL